MFCVSACALMTPQPLRKFGDKLLKVCGCGCGRGSVCMFLCECVCPHDTSAAAQVW